MKSCLLFLTEMLGALERFCKPHWDFCSSETETISGYLQSKCLLSLEGDTQPCAEVQTSSSVVLLGSPVSASCVIRDSCLLVIHQGAVIEWQLDNHTLHNSSSTSEGGKVSKVYIPSFTLPRAFLTCSIQAQVVGGVKIRAGCE